MLVYQRVVVTPDANAKAVTTSLERCGRANLLSGAVWDWSFESFGSSTVLE